MTKREAQRYVWLCEALRNHGITQDETDTLLRCSRALHTWAEHECNGVIQRNEETGKPIRYFVNHRGDAISQGQTPDREAGALKRAAAIAEAHGLTIYHQGDPRGCCLYLIRPGDVPEGKDVGSCYSDGIAICID
jgi:hypothetical protein